jgi:hypothetical protein
MDKLSRAIAAKMRSEGASAEHSAEYLKQPASLMKQFYAWLDEMEGPVSPVVDQNPADLPFSQPPVVLNSDIVRDTAPRKRGRPATRLVAPPVVKYPPALTTSAPVHAAVADPTSPRVDYTSTYKKPAKGKSGAHKYPKSNPPTKAAMESYKECPRKGCTRMIKKSDDCCSVCWSIELTGRPPLDPSLQYIGGDLRL